MFLFPSSKLTQIGVEALELLSPESSSGAATPHSRNWGLACVGQGLLGHRPSEGQKFFGPELLRQGGEMSTPEALHHALIHSFHRQALMPMLVLESQHEHDRKGFKHHDSKNEHSNENKTGSLPASSPPSHPPLPCESQKHFIYACLSLLVPKLHCS